MQRCITNLVHEIEISTSIDENLSDFRMTLLSRHVQWGIAILGTGIRVGTSLDEGLHRC